MRKMLRRWLGIEDAVKVIDSLDERYQELYIHQKMQADSNLSRYQELFCNNKMQNYTNKAIVEKYDELSSQHGALVRLVEAHLLSHKDNISLRKAYKKSQTKKGGDGE